MKANSSRVQTMHYLVSPLETYIVEYRTLFRLNDDPLDTNDRAVTRKRRPRREILKYPTTRETLNIQSEWRWRMAVNGRSSGRLQFRINRLQREAERSNISSLSNLLERSVES